MAAKRFYRRRFLNRRGFHAGAYVIADYKVDAHSYSDGPVEHSVEAVMTIADCGRIVRLDFSADTEAQVSNALFKARLLREVVNDFTAAVEDTIEEWRELR